MSAGRGGDPVRLLVVALVGVAVVMLIAGLIAGADGAIGAALVIAAMARLVNATKGDRDDVR